MENGWWNKNDGRLRLDRLPTITHFHFYVHDTRIHNNITGGIMPLKINGKG